MSQAWLRKWKRSKINLSVSEWSVYQEKKLKSVKDKLKWLEREYSELGNLNLN